VAIAALSDREVVAQNRVQQKLSSAFEPFFVKLHQGLKVLDKVVRGHEAALLEEAKQAGTQKRGAIDKQLKALKVAEQDFSLNPGCYVGVVIEEDGKTEEEFLAEILDLNGELERLNAEARQLEGIIGHNVRQLAGD
jgi:type I restriction enzyme M protein